MGSFACVEDSGTGCQRHCSVRLAVLTPSLVSNRHMSPTTLTSLTSTYRHHTLSFNLVEDLEMIVNLRVVSPEHPDDQTLARGAAAAPSSASGCAVSGTPTTRAAQAHSVTQSPAGRPRLRGHTVTSPTSGVGRSTIVGHRRPISAHGVTQFRAGRPRLRWHTDYLADERPGARPSRSASSTLPSRHGVATAASSAASPDATRAAPLLLLPRPNRYSPRLPPLHCSPTMNTRLSCQAPAPSRIPPGRRTKPGITGGRPNTPTHLAIARTPRDHAAPFLKYMILTSVSRWKQIAFIGTACLILGPAQPISNMSTSWLFGSLRFASPSLDHNTQAQHTH